MLVFCVTCLMFCRGFGRQLNVLICLHRFGNPALNAGHGNGYAGLSMIGSHSLHTVSQQKSATLPGANRTRRSPRSSGGTLPGGSASGMCGKPFGVLTLGQPGVLGYGSGMGVRLSTQMRPAPSRPVSQALTLVVCISHCSVIHVADGRTIWTS